MIFYFSGTGNALWIAKELSTAFDERLISITNELNKPKNNFTYHLQSNENIFFVFPVHSWGPAVLIYRFISKIHLDGYTNQPVYSIGTCGDNCGHTTKIMRKILRKKSIKLTKGYSIQMPNNYILMKGFSSDSIELAEQKLKNAPGLVQEVVENIKQKSDKELYTKGNLAFLKSYIIYPIFKKYALGKNRFYAKDTCISCELCVKICPTKTICFIKERPQWSNNCVQCTACINRCPVQAIEYDQISQNKRRYHHPDI